MESWDECLDRWLAGMLLVCDPELLSTVYSSIWRFRAKCVRRSWAVALALLCPHRGGSEGIGPPGDVKSSLAEPFEEDNP